MISEFVIGADEMASSFSKPDCELFPQPRANMIINKSGNLFIII
jgi:hypothetical protein